MRVVGSGDVTCVVGMSRIVAAFLLLIAMTRMIAGDPLASVGLLAVVAGVVTLSVVVLHRARTAPVDPTRLSPPPGVPHRSPKRSVGRA